MHAVRANGLDHQAGIHARPVLQPVSRRLIKVIAFSVILIAAISLRIQNLDTLPMWVDEAESSINALTILEHGVPTDSYLGLPIFENTHVWEWPESAEYEFRDVSYSDKHLAVYHGWLPLYSIAASLAIHGVKPDVADGSRETKHTLDEQKWRTRAARLPAVIFGALFLVIVFVGARAMYGRDAGWAALIAGTIYPSHLVISDQARYYSLQVTLTTACCVMLWYVIQTCRWRHVLVAAVSYILLFHTHLLGFVTACIVFVLSVPVIVYRHSDYFRKLGAFGAIVLAGTMPWVLATGFYKHQSRIPRAWPLLHIPSDLLQYPPFNLGYAAVAATIFGILLLINMRSAGSSREVLKPLQQLRPVGLLTITWAAVGYTTFILFMPAVSFTANRLNYSYWGPLFLLFVAVSAAITRALLPARSNAVHAVVAAGLLLTMHVAVHFPGWVKPDDQDASRGTFVLGHTPGEGSWDAFAEVFQQIDTMRLDVNSRIYAAPNTHLILTFYSGLPIQDITPVRKSFLDNYPGEIIYLDRLTMTASRFLTQERILRTARNSGNPMTAEAASQASVLLSTRGYRQAIAETLAPGEHVELEPVPAFLRPLLEAHRREEALNFTRSGFELVTGPYEIRNWLDWVDVFKYRFVNPDSRRGQTRTSLSGCAARMR